MRVKLQLVLGSDDGQDDIITAIVILKKDAQRIEHLGFTRKEATQLLNTRQTRLLPHQVAVCLDGCSTCPDCDTPLKANGSHTRTLRTVFGTLKLSSPRLFHCRCRRRKTTSFRPLAALLPESVAPALLVRETKWSSLVSAPIERGCHWGQQQVFPQAKDCAESPSLRHRAKRNTQTTQGMSLI
jgi:hypothetical protein